MDLSAGESIIYQGHPSWRSILAFYLKGLVLAVVLGALAAGVSQIAEDEVRTEWIAVVVIVALLVMVVVGYLKRVATEYTITTRRLHIRRGILRRSTEETRVERIQNTNTSQSVLERMLRVGTVDFDVASDERAGLFKFEGVENPATVVRAVDRALSGEARAGVAPGEEPAPPPLDQGL